MVGLVDKSSRNRQERMRPFYSYHCQTDRRNLYSITWSWLQHFRSTIYQTHE